MKFEHTVEINRPVEEVFEFVASPENDARWSEGLVVSRKTSEGAMGRGSTGRRAERFGARQIEIDWEVIEFQRNQKITFKTTSGDFRFEGGYTLESLNGGTRLSYVGEGELGLFARVVGTAMERTARKQMEEDYNRLKTLLESRGTPYP